jgi:SNF2 family DNA or RNA helicase
MIHVSTKHRTVGVPARPELLGLFPSAPVFDINGERLIALPHGTSETRLLRNMGLPVPAPVLSQYDWCNGKPFEVQRKTAALLTTSPRAYVLNGMGTGKTKSALWSWHYLRSVGQANKLLVVAPLSTLNFTWGREIIGTLTDVRYQVLHGDRQRRLKRLADRDVDVYIVNHDGLAVIAPELATRPDIDTLVLDELAAYRNPTAQRTKLTREVAKRFKWVWGMTGSPTPNEPCDAWGQCSIVTPETVPARYTRFREEVMHKVTTFKWVPKRNAIDRVHEVMQPAVRFTLDDVVELPDLVERTIDVEMGTKQARVYREIEAYAQTMIASETITAVNAGAALMKLLQISCGWVYTGDGSTVPLDNDKRLDALSDLVEGAARKVIVFVPFKHALAGIHARLTKEGFDVAPPISGDTPANERGRIFNVFQNTDKHKVLAAHPQCMAHGITLTAADTIVWFSPTPDLEIFEQANARIRRVGQKHKQQVLMFQSTKVEARMYAKLRAKQKVQNNLLDLFASSTT